MSLVIILRIHLNNLLIFLVAGTFCLKIHFKEFLTISLPIFSSFRGVTLRV